MSNVAIAGAPVNKWGDLGDALAAFDPRYTAGKSLDLRTVSNGFRKWLGRVIENKRLDWNCRVFEGGKRKGFCPNGVKMVAWI